MSLSLYEIEKDKVGTQPQQANGRANGLPPDPDDTDITSCTPLPDRLYHSRPSYTRL